MNTLGHKDYTIQPEPFTGLIPSDTANEIADYFATGKMSETDVVGKLRINGKKVHIQTIKIVFEHIRTIEKTCYNILKGTSILFQEPTDITEKLNWIKPAIPTSKDELLSAVMQVIAKDSTGFTNVYDADFVQLSNQVINVIENIIKAQNNGLGTWEDYYNAVISL